ncbi:hypothetical protein LguiA_012022 [Lonicera macranthoides]
MGCNYLAHMIPILISAEIDTMPRHHGAFSPINDIRPPSNAGELDYSPQDVVRHSGHTEIFDQLQRNQFLQEMNNLAILTEDLLLKLKVHPKEIGTSKYVRDELELLPMELANSNFSTYKLKISSWKKFYLGLITEPRKNPEFSFPSVARTFSG